MRCPGPVRDALPRGDPLAVPSANVVVSARLMDVETGRVMARYVDWPEPYRFLQPPDPGLTIEAKTSRENEGHITMLELKVERPVKCLALSVKDADANPQVKWSDNALDLVPGDVQTVIVHGLNGRSVQVGYFGNEKVHDVVYVS